MVEAEVRDIYGRGGNFWGGGRGLRMRLNIIYCQSIEHDRQITI